MRLQRVVTFHEKGHGWDWRLWSRDASNSVVKLSFHFFIRSRYFCRFWEIKILPCVNIQNGTSHVVLVVKNLPANAGNSRGTVSIPDLGRYPGRGHGNPLQYSCLGNPKDRGTWQATAHGVAKSQTRLSTHTHNVQNENIQMHSLCIRKKVDSPRVQDA